MKTLGSFLGLEDELLMNQSVQDPTADIIEDIPILLQDKVVKISFIHKEKKRLLSLFLIFSYLVIGILYGFAITTQLNSYICASTNVGVRDSIGFISSSQSPIHNQQYNKIQSIAQIYNWLYNATSLLFSQGGGVNNDAIFREYLHVYNGFMLFKSKRFPCIYQQSRGPNLSWPCYGTR